MQISATSPFALYPRPAGERPAVAGDAGPEAARGSGTPAGQSQETRTPDARQEARPLGQQQEAQSPEERQALQQLQARDREVRAHELAHVAAGAGLVRGGAAFSYQRGPDGRYYAVGGEVGIDTSAVPGDPVATQRKAEQILRAALAPAQPSGQDRAVAAQAARMAMEARLQQALETAAPEEQGGDAATPQIDLYA
jgi:hypothetical protein